jgi:uncharacterized protein YigE (DUF2233 family)
MRLLALALLLAPVAAQAAECRDTTFEGASYTLCEVAAGEDLRLFHSGPDGAYGSFRNVMRLGAEGKTLGFAMNAGMYHRDLAPVGLYVEDGVEVAAGHAGRAGEFRPAAERRLLHRRDLSGDRKPHVQGRPPDCRLPPSRGRCW